MWLVRADDLDNIQQAGHEIFREIRGVERAHRNLRLRIGLLRQIERARVAALTPANEIGHDDVDTESTDTD